MIHKEGFFSNTRGQSIYYQGWLPDDRIKASILIIHGLHEHCSRYQRMAEYLTGKDYAVYGLDLPGHGKSDGTRAFIESFADLLEPIETCLELIKSAHPDLPVFLVGHSMGGLIAAAYMIEHPNHVAGSVLSGSLVKVPEYITDFTIQIGRFLSKALPKFRIVEIDKEGLSRDPEVVQAYINDPLVYNGKTTVRISNEINFGIDLVEEYGSKITEPVLLLHGGEDRICDPAWSQYLYDLISSPDKKLIIYDGLYHEVYNEPEFESVFADVLDWLNGHLP